MKAIVVIARSASLLIFATSKRAPTAPERPDVSAFDQQLRPYHRLLENDYTIWCNVGMDQLTDVLTANSHPARRAIIGPRKWAGLIFGAPGRPGHNSGSEGQTPPGRVMKRARPKRLTEITVYTNG